MGRTAFTVMVLAKDNKVAVEAQLDEEFAEWQKKLEAGWRGLWPRRAEGGALVAFHTVELAASPFIPYPSR